MGHFAYVLEGAKELTDIHPEHLVLEYNQKIIKGDYIFGAVCNITRLGGGLIKFSNRVIDMNDGLFELLLIKFPKNPGQLMQLIMDLNSGNFKGKLFEFIKTDNLKISTSSSMDWTLDGEYEKGTEKIEITVQKSAFSLIVPNKKQN